MPFHNPRTRKEHTEELLISFRNQDPGIGSYNLGTHGRRLVRHLTRDFTGAINDYTKALEINPRFIEAYVNRGETCLAMDDLEGARADFQKALQLSPPGWPYRAKLEAYSKKLKTGR